MAESIKKRNSTSSNIKKEDAEVRTYQPNDEINCYSVTSGELIMIGRKTKNIYTWTNYGDITPVEYQDLKAEKLNSRSRYIYDPLFVIDDEELLSTPEFKNVCEIYNSTISKEEIENIFDLDPGNLQRTLKSLPKGFQSAIKNIAATKILDGSLDSIKKIKIIDENLGTDLYSYLDI